MPGAPVEFRGIPIGEVADIRAQIDLKTLEFSVPVTIHLDPQRLGVKVHPAGVGADLEAMRRKMIDAWCAHGVRAQLRTGNLLTGAVFVAFDFFPGAPPATVDWSQTPCSCRPFRVSSRRWRPRSRDIINKLDKMPLQQIGDELRTAIAELDQTLVARARHAG